MAITTQFAERYVKMDELKRLLAEKFAAGTYSIDARPIPLISMA